MQMPLETREEKTLKLKKITKEKNLYRLFFSEDKSLLCNEDDIFEYQLYKDAKISNETFNTLQKKNDYYLCLNDAIKIINTRQYSTKQVNDRLLNLDHDKYDIEQVISYLESINLLNDEEFYNSYVEFKVNQGYGPLYIKNKLYVLGISRSVVIEYDKQYEMIKKQLLKKKNTKQSKSVFIQKIRTKLLNQGFSSDIINDVINDNPIEEDSNAIRNDYNKLLNKYQKKYEGYKLKNTIKQKMISMGYEVFEIESLMEEGL